jgi:predicted short-subunit dehydrogenase-like oxidoreductase (DUF2520 family)
MKQSKRYSVAIIGAGRVGTAMAVMLAKAGHRISGVASRNRDDAEHCARLTDAGMISTNPVDVAVGAKMILFTVPDDQIGPVCQSLAANNGFRRGQMVLHASGALGSNVLAPAAKKGCHVASVHPFQSFATADQAMENLPGSYFGLEGSKEAVAVLEKLIPEVFEGTVILLDERTKPVYHAAACIASSFVVVLTQAAVELLLQIGLEKDETVRVLIPLLRGTVENISLLGLPKALTGPIERGDVLTIREHLQAVEARRPRVASLYRELGLKALDIAVEKGGLPRDKVLEIRGMFERPEK